MGDDGTSEASGSTIDADDGDESSPSSDDASDDSPDSDDTDPSRVEDPDPSPSSVDDADDGSDAAASPQEGSASAGVEAEANPDAVADAEVDDLKDPALIPEPAVEDATEGEPLAGDATEAAHVADDGAMAATADEITDEQVERAMRPSRRGPAEDREMPLADHIEEMLKRLAIVIVVAGSATIVVFPMAAEIIDFLWYSVLPGGDIARPRVYGPLEFLLTKLKVASLAGLIVALPVMVYESYKFMRPGLYRRERRYYLAAVPTSLVLAVIGVLFAYFIVLPAIFTYFLAYSEGAGEIAFALARTFDLILLLMAYLAIVFQIPLIIMLAIMMGITTRAWLQSKRLYFWGAFLGLAFLSSPDPTGMAPIIVALTMVGLFEGTLLLLRWVGR